MADQSKVEQSGVHLDDFLGEFKLQPYFACNPYNVDHSSTLLLQDPKDFLDNLINPKKKKVRNLCDDYVLADNRNFSGIRKRRFGTPSRRRKMAKVLTLEQHQRHSIQLMARVLGMRAIASPFTLIIDDLNQRAMPLVAEFVRRGLSRNINVIVISFEATRFHPLVHNITAYGDQSGNKIMQQIRNAMEPARESIVIVDSLSELQVKKHINLSALFKLVVVEFASNLIGVYHQDQVHVQDVQNAYYPPPVDVFKYMATAVITCKSFAHVLEAKAAKERSLPEPTHGLLQGAEGIVQSLDANDDRGIVLEAEFRRRSGRSESETYFLRTARDSDYNSPTAGLAVGTLKQEFITLLDMVPEYAGQAATTQSTSAGSEIESTFNLGLTDKQKLAREGIVLPYFDAQKGEGGEGGRILYDMGAEDDFDEEEDEI